MASNVAKKLLLIGAGGGTYVAAVLLSYQLMTASRTKNNNMSEGQREQIVLVPPNYGSNTNSVHTDGTLSNTTKTEERTTNAISITRNKEETYRRVASTYDDTIGRDEFVMGTLLLRRALLYFHARGTVLEVAAGTGRNLQYYPSSAVTKVVVLDSSEPMLQRAQQKIQQQEKKNEASILFETSVADATKLVQYDDNTFDTVVDTFGLCSFDDPVAVLQELRRVCKPEGKILLLEHGRSKSYQGMSNYLDKHAEQHAQNWNCIWNRDIEQIVRDSGLHIQSFYNWHFGTTYYMVCTPNKTDATKK